MAPMGTFTQLNKPWFYCLTWTKRHPNYSLLVSPSLILTLWSLSLSLSLHLLALFRRISYELHDVFHHWIVNLNPWYSSFTLVCSTSSCSNKSSIICAYIYDCSTLSVCKNACVIDQLTRSAFYLILAVSVKLLTSCFLQFVNVVLVRNSVNQTLLTRQRSISHLFCATILSFTLISKVIWANHLLANRELKLWNNSSCQKREEKRYKNIGQEQCATSWIYLLTVSIFRSIVSTLINCCKILFAPQIFEH